MINHLSILFEMFNIPVVHISSIKEDETPTDGVPEKTISPEDYEKFLKREFRFMEFPINYGTIYYIKSCMEKIWRKISFVEKSNVITDSKIKYRRRKVSTYASQNELVSVEIIKLPPICEETIVESFIDDKTIMFKYRKYLSNIVAIHDTVIVKHPDSSEEKIMWSRMEDPHPDAIHYYDVEELKVFDCGDDYIKFVDTIDIGDTLKNIQKFL